MQLNDVIKQKATTWIVVGVFVFFFLGWMTLSLLPPRADLEEAVIHVEKGDGFLEVVARLENAGLIRSPLAFTLYLFLSGNATKLQAATYTLTPALAGWEIAERLVADPRRELSVRIPEGASEYAVADILVREGVVEREAFIGTLARRDVEGYLFPDTYRFFANSDPEEVIRRFLLNFEQKATPLLERDPERERAHLIVASILEREVPTFEEQRIVAGVIEKRLAAGMPLQIDAAICYIKEMRNEGGPCYPLLRSEFSVESPYNTYLRQGLPEGPIGSPGLAAIEAAMDPKDSPYWFYLSDPATGETHFSETLEEHEEKRSLYIFGGGGG